MKEYLEINKDPGDQLDDFSDLEMRDENIDDEEVKTFDVGDKDINNSDSTIRVYLKDFFLDVDTKRLFDEIIPLLDHKNDGIVYTMNDCPYYPGTCPEIIKWKPASLNSIDFMLK